jgi:LysR family cys regulon transcriptional activator
MNFQQLRIIRETVRRGFNLTEVAEALHTSQSGVSKHIKDLEDELGGELYIRRGKRLLGLTELGRGVARIAERMLLDAHNIRNLADQYSQQDAGELTVATTHTQARYVLPRVIARFRQEYPRVHLRLHQGSPREIARMLQEGVADIGIATEVLGHETGLVSFPYHTWRHALVLPEEHPLAEAEPGALTLEAIASYPIITYHEGFTGRAQIERAFDQAGAVPDIVMSAMDADVIKSYVRVGLGIGIIASIAYEPDLDVGLTLRRCDHLFDTNVTHIAIRRGHLLRRYAYTFMQFCSPELTRERVLAEDPTGEVLVASI